MSRDRNQREPFYATDLGRMQPNGQRLARGIDALIKRSPALRALLWVGSGWRSNSSEHKTGRALDVIATRVVGLRARTAEPAAWAAMERLIHNALVPNAKKLGIRHIIWDRRIYRTRFGEWGALPGRTASSSVSDWHEDHAHIWLDPGAAGWLPELDKLVLGGPNLPTPAPIPIPAGALKVGSRGDKVRALQQGLVTVFPAYAKAVAHQRGQTLAVDGVFGAHTDAWVREFQARAGLVVDGIVGTATTAALKKHGITLDTAPKPAPSKPARSVDQMAREVIDGKHGVGHENRRRSLGIDATTYTYVRARVNELVSGGGGKTVAQMASEVIAGKHGTGHEHRQRSLGIDSATYARVRAEVNRRVGR